eukprot:c7654_g1_i1.p2 GENE.c7654_g1_i1~~c7654_g1_i1.p2  ORF type:complete len:119 (-),score=2.77 c7654_g1_i1:26-382(-)
MPHDTSTLQRSCSQSTRSWAYKPAVPGTSPLGERTPRERQQSGSRQTTSRLSSKAATQRVHRAARDAGLGDEIVAVLHVVSDGVRWHGRLGKLNRRYDPAQIEDKPREENHCEESAYL